MSAKFNPDLSPYVNPANDRRVALVTGGNSGIGWFTVLHLYLHGFVVYLGGRSKSRCLKAIAEIRKESELRRSAYTKDQLQYRFVGELKFLEIDLLDLKSVEDAALQFQNLESSLNLLINNAGVMAIPFSITNDNFEIQVQTNYVAPFLFTQRLVPLIERTPGSRIIYLSTIGHHFAFMYFNMNSKFNYSPNILFTWFRYGIAKTAGIQYIKMLALKYPNILCLAVHPGFVMNTNLFGYWTSLPIIGSIFWVFFQIFGHFFGVTNEEGSYATLKCALDDKLTPQKDNGKYFATGGVESQPSAVASNMDYAARSWIWTVHELSDRNIDVSTNN